VTAASSRNSLPNIKYAGLTLISSVTDAVTDEVKAWQAHPLEALYPIVYLDCIHAKVRDSGAVRVKAVYLALGVDLNGDKELLGLWVAQTEGAKFWLQVTTALKNRGVQDTSLPAWMASKAFLKRLRRCSQRRRCSCVSCIGCATA